MRGEPDVPRAPTAKRPVTTWLGPYCPSRRVASAVVSPFAEAAPACGVAFAGMGALEAGGGAPEFRPSVINSRGVLPRHCCRHDYEPLRLSRAS
jgi:hypothetical protein